MRWKTEWYFFNKGGNRKKEKEKTAEINLLEDATHCYIFNKRTPDKGILKILKEISNTVLLFRVNFSGYYEIALLPRSGGVYDQYEDEWQRINLLKKLLNKQIDKKKARDKLTRK